MTAAVHHVYSSEESIERMAKHKLLAMGDRCIQPAARSQAASTRAAQKHRTSRHLPRIFSVPPAQHRFCSDTHACSVRPLFDNPMRSGLLEMLHVFNGHANDPAEKLSLVLPFLGLYAELYACTDMVTADPFLHKVANTIALHKRTIFPSSMLLPPKGSAAVGGARRASGTTAWRPSRRGSKAAGAAAGAASPAGRGGKSSGEAAAAAAAPTRVSLFGSLLGAMEALIDSDAELKAELRAQGGIRRGVKLAAAAEVRTNTREPRTARAAAQKALRPKWNWPSRKSRGALAENSTCRKGHGWTPGAASHTHSPHVV